MDDKWKGFPSDLLGIEIRRHFDEPKHLARFMPYEDVATAVQSIVLFSGRIGYPTEEESACRVLLWLHDLGLLNPALNDAVSAMRDRSGELIQSATDEMSEARISINKAKHGIREARRQLDIFRRVKEREERIYSEAERMKRCAEIIGALVTPTCDPDR
jgi:hypothetical protein